MISIQEKCFRQICQSFSVLPDEILSYFEKNSLSKTLVWLETRNDLKLQLEAQTVICGALVIYDIYQTCPLTVIEYAKLFRRLLKPQVYTFMMENAQELQSFINYESDFQIDYFAAQTLANSYLARAVKGDKPNEIPQMAYLRMAVSQHLWTQYVSSSSGQTQIQPNPESSLNSTSLRSYLTYPSLKSGLNQVWYRFSSYLTYPSWRMSLRTENQVTNDRSLEEERRNRLEKIKVLMKAYSSRLIGASSPMYFNLGFRKGTSISCILLTVGDNVGDIFDVLKEGGKASKGGSGLGVDFSHIRHSGIGVKSHMSKGVLPIMKIWDDTIYVMTQNNRPGACAASLTCHHRDFPDFITCLDPSNDPERFFRYLKLSAVFHDLFFERALKKENWTLFCPAEAEGLTETYGSEFEQLYLSYERKTKQEKADAQKSLISETFSAYDLLLKLCEYQIKTGGPFLVHGDRINKRNPLAHHGKIYNLNLCQEICLPAIGEKETATCNLSSLNLGRMVKPDRTFDFDLFASTTRQTVTNLNGMLDAIDPETVSEKVMRSNNYARPLGIGVCGFSDMLYQMDLSPVETPYSSSFSPEEDLGSAPAYDPASLLRRRCNPEVKKLNRLLWSCMYYNALKQSMEEAKLHGPCPGFTGSAYAQGKLQYHLAQEDVATFPAWSNDYSLEPCSPAEWGDSEGSWSTLIEDIKTYGLRNMTLLSIQPTATSSRLANANESVEFPTTNLYFRRLMSGIFRVANEWMIKDLEAIDLWNEKTFQNIYEHDGSLLHLTEEGLTDEQIYRLRFLKEKYLTAWEIPKMITVELAAERQPFICHSQSMNLFIEDPTPQKLAQIHFYIWKKGLKTGLYYLRTRSAGAARVMSSPIQKDKKEGRIDSIQRRRTEPIPSSVSEPKQKEPETKNFCNLNDPDCQSCSS